MNILKQLSYYHQSLRDIGVEPHMGALERAQVQMLNYVAIGVIVLTLSMITIFIDDVIVEDIPLIIATLAFSFLLLYLNKKGKNFFGQIIFHTIFPLLSVLTMALYGKVNHDEAYFGLTIALGFVSFTSRKHQIIVVLWNLICYSIGFLSNYYFGIPYPFEIGLIESYTFGTVTIILIVAMAGFLIRTNYEFGNKIIVLTKKLEKQNKELHETNMDLKNFVQVASHDLKAPLRSIISFQKLIERKVKPLEDESLNEFLHFSTTSAQQMQLVLDDLLKYSQLEKEVALNDLKAVDFKGIVDQIMVELQHSTDKESIIKLEGELENFKGINSQVKLMMQNLIGNGLKYNESEIPEVVVSTETIEDEVIIKVKDNGIGIAPEYQEQIFEPFRRLHSSSEYEGTGFGLAITKRIVEKIGGEIQIESQLGEGTEFRISFPKARA